jgi:hypothetical protein
MPFSACLYLRMYGETLKPLVTFFKNWKITQRLSEIFWRHVDTELLQIITVNLFDDAT